jgi:nucleotide-binding universal stress UspA family protein
LPCVVYEKGSTSFGGSFASSCYTANPTTGLFTEVARARLQQSGWIAKRTGQAKEVLRKRLWRVQAAGGAVAGAHLRRGGIAEEVVRLAEELGVGLIAMGSRGHGGKRRALMGSVSNSVVRHAYCPVMIVRG